MKYRIHRSIRPALVFYISVGFCLLCSSLAAVGSPEDEVLPADALEDVDLGSKVLGLLWKGIRGAAPLRSVHENGNVFTWSEAGVRWARRDQLSRKLQFVSFSPDGERVLYLSGSGRLFLGDLNRSSEALSIEIEIEPKGEVSSIGLGSGSVVVFGTSSGKVCSWVEKAQPVGGAKGATTCRALHSAPVTAIALASNGAVASFSSLEAVFISAESGEAESLGRLEKPTTVKIAEFSPGGQGVLTGDHEGNIRYWDLTKGKEISSRLLGKDTGLHGSAVLSLDIDPSGKRAVTGDQNGRIVLWSLKSGKGLELPFGLQQRAIEDLAFSPDGARVAAGTSAGSIRVLDTNAGEIHQVFSSYGNRATALALSAEGNLLAIAAPENQIALWDLSNRSLIRMYRLSSVSDPNSVPSEITALAVEKGNGSISVAAGFNNPLEEIQLLRFPEGDPAKLPSIRLFSTKKITVGALQLDLERSCIYVGSEGSYEKDTGVSGLLRKVCFASDDQGSTTEVSRRTEKSLVSMALSARGDRIVVGLAGGQLGFFSADSLSPLPRAGASVQGTPSALAWTDRTSGYYSSRSRANQAVDLLTWRMGRASAPSKRSRQVLKSPRALAALSRDGMKAAWSSGDDGIVRVDFRGKEGAFNHSQELAWNSQGRWINCRRGAGGGAQASCRRFDDGALLPMANRLSQRAQLSVEFQKSPPSEIDAGENLPVYVTVENRSNSSIIGLRLRKSSKDRSRMIRFVASEGLVRLEPGEKATLQGSLIGGWSTRPRSSSAARLELAHETGAPVGLNPFRLKLQAPVPRVSRPRVGWMFEKLKINVKNIGDLRLPESTVYVSLPEPSTSPAAEQIRSLNPGERLVLDKAPEGVGVFGTGVCQVEIQGHDHPNQNWIKAVKIRRHWLGDAFILIIIFSIMITFLALSRLVAASNDSR